MDKKELELLQENTLKPGFAVPITSGSRSGVEYSQHIYHHSDYDGPKANFKIERNTKGYNWEITIVGARNYEEASKLFQEMKTFIESQIVEE